MSGISKIDIQKNRLLESISLDKNHEKALEKLLNGGKKKPSNTESKTQKAFVEWFRYQFPQYKLLLVSIPNGGKRSKITASIMKAEGQISGAPDLFLFLQRCGYGGFAIETKTATGTQSDAQKAWQAEAEKQGYLYQIIRDVEVFKVKVTEYILNVLINHES